MHTYRYVSYCYILYIHRLPGGVGTNGVFTEGPHISYMLTYFTSSAYICHMLQYFVSVCLHFPMIVDYRELRHFCDDPICPDHVWKLSRDELRQNLRVHCTLIVPTCFSSIARSPVQAGLRRFSLLATGSFRTGALRAACAHAQGPGRSEERKGRMPASRRHHTH